METSPRVGRIILVVETTADLEGTCSELRASLVGRRFGRVRIVDLIGRDTRQGIALWDEPPAASSAEAG